MKPCDEWNAADIAAWHHSRRAIDLAASCDCMAPHLDPALEAERLASVRAMARRLSEPPEPPRDFDAAIKDAKALEVDAPAWLPIGVVAGAAMIGAVVWWLA